MSAMTLAGARPCVISGAAGMQRFDVQVRAAAWKDTPLASLSRQVIAASQSNAGNLRSPEAGIKPGPHDSILRRRGAGGLSNETGAGGMAVLLSYSFTK